MFYVKLGDQPKGSNGFQVHGRPQIKGDANLAEMPCSTIYRSDLGIACVVLYFILIVQST